MSEFNENTNLQDDGLISTAPASASAFFASRMPPVVSWSVSANAESPEERARETSSAGVSVPSEKEL